MIANDYPTYINMVDQPYGRTESLMWHVRNIFIMGELDKAYNGDFKSLHDDWVKVYNETPLSPEIFDELVGAYHKYDAWENKNDLHDKLESFKFLPYKDVNLLYDYNTAQKYLGEFLSEHIIACRTSKNIEDWMTQHITYTQIYSTIVYKVDDVPAFSLCKSYMRGCMDMRVITPNGFKNFVKEIMEIRADDICKDIEHTLDYKIADYLEAPDDEVLLTKNEDIYVFVNEVFVLFDKEIHGGMTLFKRVI